MPSRSCRHQAASFALGFAELFPDQAMIQATKVPNLPTNDPVKERGLDSRPDQQQAEQTAATALATVAGQRVTIVGDRSGIALACSDPLGLHS